MDENRILNLACAKLGVSKAQVASHHIYEDHIALVVNMGIAGSPKYKIPLETLEKPIETQPESVAEVVKPKETRKRK